MFYKPDWLTLYVSSDPVCFLWQSGYSRLQPFDRPEVDSLVGKKHDYLFGFGAANETDYQLIWCQGEMIKVGANPNKPNTVSVRWNLMQNSDTYNDYHEANVDLLPIFWNKDKERAWRMDIDVDILTVDSGNSDEETDEESG